MPGYVNLLHRTFVCTKCSGIHRELQFKVKGISMSVFTPGDVADLSVGGNLAFNAVYMARYQVKEFALPSGSDIGKLRDFIKKKYVERKWHSDDGNYSSNNNSSYSGSTYSGNTIAAAPSSSTSDTGERTLRGSNPSLSSSNQPTVVIKVEH